MPSDAPTADIRYARHVVLDGIGDAGQAAMGSAHVLIFGLGGLGCPAALYLATSGIGRLTLCDFDRVDVTNLPRQVLFADADIGRSKAEAACAAVTRLNPQVQAAAVTERLQGDALAAAVAAADVVVDATDNFGARFAINAACVAARRPLVSGAAIRFEGQVAVFRADVAPAPCYACLYDERHEDLEDCRGNGVLAPLVGVIGSLMASETIKVICGLGESSRGRVTLYDAKALRFRQVGLSARADCAVCAGTA